jgi:hypothetical protein
VADNLGLDLDLNFKGIAFAAVSGRDREPGKRVLKPQRLYEIDGNDCKVGEVSIRAHPAHSSKARKK